LIIGIVNGGDNVAVKNKYYLSVRAIKTQKKNILLSPTKCA